MGRPFGDPERPEKEEKESGDDGDMGAGNGEQMEQARFLEVSGRLVHPGAFSEDRRLENGPFGVLPGRPGSAKDRSMRSRQVRRSRKSTGTERSGGPGRGVQPARAFRRAEDMEIRVFIYATENSALKFQLFRGDDLGR